MNNETSCQVEVELTLEEWGRIALQAHARDVTINEMFVIILEAEIARVKELEENGS